ncbi:MAG: endonuclease III [Planctomycetota bacterium]|jgi:endonuclease III
MGLLVAAKNSLQKMFAVFEKKYGGVRTFTEERPLDQLIMLILASGSTQEKAAEALDSLRREFVDWNEVRVTALHDVDLAIACLGSKAIVGKAAMIRSALSTIYARFNRVDLDALLEKGDKQVTRKRDRLFAYFAERSPFLPPLMTCFLNGGKAQVQVTSSVGRVLTRTGVFKKGTTPSKMRAELESAFSIEEQLLFVNGIYAVAEGLCHRTLPDCKVCPLMASCKAAPEEMDKQKKAEEAARAKARKEARRLAQKIAKEAKAATERAEKERKKEAAKVLSEQKKKEAARKKAEAKKQAETKKKSDVKKAETAKKKAAAVKKKVGKKKDAPTKVTPKNAAKKKDAPKKAATKSAAKKATKKATQKVAKKKVAAKKKTATKKKVAAKKKVVSKKKAATKPKATTKKKAAIKKKAARKKKK